MRRPRLLSPTRPDPARPARTGRDFESCACPLSESNDLKSCLTTPWIPWRPRVEISVGVIGATCT